MVELLSVRKIWDHAPHNAFTDLLYAHEAWWCTFREAEEHGHVPATIRILRSEDGTDWTSVAELVDPGVDLRDPKLSLMPDGRLLLLTCANFIDAQGRYTTRSPRVSFSADGRQWTPLEKCLAEDHWLWRVTWHDDVGYSVSKLGIGNNPRRGFLYRTTDARQWDFVAEFLLPHDTWTASETTVHLRPEGDMVALIRPDWIGTSPKPYVDWSFTRIEQSLGGPNFIILPDGAMWAAARGRGPDGQAATVLARMTDTSYTPVLVLPSGGDCSYAGMVWYDGLLWMTYYSSHESKSSIYLAKMRLDE
ncbi:MAG: exo-alpha-sialidase [bacterium]|nr:exo-alpha-sialidase [bacterium]